MNGGRGGEGNAKGWRGRAEIIQGGKGGERKARNAALSSRLRLLARMQL